MSQEPLAPEEHEPFDPDPEVVAGLDDVDAEAEIEDPADDVEVAEEGRPHDSEDEGDLP